MENKFSREFVEEYDRRKAEKERLICEQCKQDINSISEQMKAEYKEFSRQNTKQTIFFVCGVILFSISLFVVGCILDYIL